MLANAVDESRAPRFLIPCGHTVGLMLEDDAGARATLLDHDGLFASTFAHTFLASAVDESASMSPSKDDNMFLTLEIRMDLYPEEISFQLRQDKVVEAIAVERRTSGVVFFRPPRFYHSSHTNQIVREVIPIPPGAQGSLQHFTLIMTDSFGDGKLLFFHCMMHS